MWCGHFSFPLIKRYDVAYPKGDEIGITEVPFLIIWRI